MLGNLVKGKEWYYDIRLRSSMMRTDGGTAIRDVPVVASRDDLYETVIQMMVDEVFICLPGIPVIEIRDMVQRFEEMGLVCHYNVDLFSRANPNTYVQQMAGYSVIFFCFKKYGFKAASN